MTQEIDTLQIVERFLKATGMAPSRFGRECADDKNLVKRLRAGVDVRMSTHRKVVGFIKSQMKEVA